MHQYRYDPTADRWVIIAEGRSCRPEEFEKRPSRRVSSSCPFCAGNEHLTPKTLEYLPGDGAPAGNRPWQVRVVSNKYPAASLDQQASTQPHGDAPQDALPNGALSNENHPVCRLARGVHEVIIESPDHVSSFAEVDEEVAALTFLAYRNRVQAASRVAGMQYAQVFKNEGPDAGASLDHAHSQLLATPFVPRDIQLERAQCEQWYREQAGCVFCHLVEQARGEGRVVAEHEGLVAFCPFASRFPYEVWIVPDRHQSRFDQESDATVRNAGLLTRAVVRRIRATIDRLPYNLWIHSDPFDTHGSHHYHWHIEIAPRYNPTAGYEFGGGAYINPVAPETAAKQLRNAAEEMGSRDEAR